MELELVRISNTSQGMFGVFTVNMIPFCLSVEKPWRGNNVMISCIPGGSYVCRPYKHRRWGSCFLLEDVPGRSEIMIHPANLQTQLHGCIAPGTSYDQLNGEDGVHQSRRALDEIIAVVQNQTFTLHVWQVSS